MAAAAVVHLAALVLEGKRLREVQLVCQAQSAEQMVQEGLQGRGAEARASPVETLGQFQIPLVR
jgi:hypothetical protein